MFLYVAGLCNNFVIRNNGETLATARLDSMGPGRSILLISVDENIVSPALDSLWSLKNLTINADQKLSLHQLMLALQSVFGRPFCVLTKELTQNVYTVVYILIMLVYCT